MKVLVLGSAAGGGFPQWNCNCANCYGVRNGTVKAVPRTQSSIAISADNDRWVLINASPDIRAQLESFPELQPRRGLRDTGILAVVLMDAQIDHTAGLLFLREGCPLTVCTTEAVREDLSNGFPVFEMLKHWNGGIQHRDIPIDGTRFEVEGCSHLQFTAVSLKAKAPPYSPHRNLPHPGDNIGLLIEDLRDGGSVFYAPGLGEIDDELRAVMRRSDCLLLDGTFWREDEMIFAGVGTSLAEEMGHMPQSGPGGMIEALREMENQRKILIHVNNTNPILVEDGPERRMLDSAGIEVAFDGMQFVPAAGPVAGAPVIRTALP